MLRWHKAFLKWLLNTLGMNFIIHKNEPQNKTNLFTISIQSHLLHEYNPPQLIHRFYPGKVKSPQRISPKSFPMRFTVPRRCAMPSGPNKAASCCKVMRSTWTHRRLVGDASQRGVVGFFVRTRVMKLPISWGESIQYLNSNFKKGFPL